MEVTKRGKLAWKWLNRTQFMAIPPIIPQDGGEPPVIPSVAGNVPPRIGQYVPGGNRPVVEKRSQNKWKFVAIGGGVGFLLIAALVLLGVRSNKSPRDSILALGSAIERRDRETIAAYVDATALAESIRRSARESMKLEMGKEEQGGFIENMLGAFAEEAVVGISEIAITPESVMAILCGEDPKEAMKGGLTEYTDQTVDGFTKDGDLKTQAYGAAGKVLLRMAVSAVIDEAVKQPGAKPEPMNLEDMEVAAVYESPDRYLITMKPRDLTQPGFGWVFKRHGSNYWKWTEVRLLPQSPARIETAAVP